MNRDRAEAIAGWWAALVELKAWEDHDLFMDTQWVEDRIAELRAILTGGPKP